MNATVLQFEEATHTYAVDGVAWPSVTKILDPLLELDGIPRDILRAAAEFGKNVHAATDFYDKGTLDESDLDEPLRPYLEAWKCFLRDTGAIVLESERRVWHPTLKVAGTLDKVIRMPSHSNRRHILDVKSGEVPWTVGMQVSAYLELLRQQESDRSQCKNPEWLLSNERYCCQLRDDGTYRLETLGAREHNGDWNDFISARNVHYMRMRHGRKN